MKKSKHGEGFTIKSAKQISKLCLCLSNHPSTGHSNGQESWGRDSGARDLSPDHRPHSSGTGSQMTENEANANELQLINHQVRGQTPPVHMVVLLFIAICCAHVQCLLSESTVGKLRKHKQTARIQLLFPSTWFCPRLGHNRQIPKSH